MLVKILPSFSKRKEDITKFISHKIYLCHKSLLIQRRASFTSHDRNCNQLYIFKN